MVGQNLSPRPTGASSDTHAAAWAVVTAEEMTSAAADGTAVETEATVEVAAVATEAVALVEEAATAVNAAETA